MSLIDKIRPRAKNVQIFLVAFVLASALWYVVVGSGQVETQVEIRLDFRSLPEEYVVQSGLVTSIKARLRGPSELLNSFQHKDLVYTIDLSEVQEGANVFPIDLNKSIDLRAFEVVNVDPYRLIVEVDKVIFKEVPLELVASNIETIDMDIQNMQLDPTSVRILGPQKILEELSTLEVTFAPYAGQEEGIHSLNLSISVPAQVEVFPAVTTLSYEVFLRRELQVLELPIQLRDEGSRNLQLDTKTAKVTVDVPLSKIKEGVIDPKYLEMIIPYVTVPSSISETASLLLFVDVPDTAKLMSIDPSSIVIEEIHEVEEN